MLSPGDRVVIKGGQVIVRDRPNVLNATAWQTGRLVFENEPLIGAVAEMNRYSQRPLVVTDPTLAAQRVSGIFNASDAEGFAQSVSILLATPVRITPNAIILGGPESLPPFST
jgi:transmembrane sensor